MKVIFLENVPNIAKVSQIKEVANGYGKNFLIPKKLAVMVKPDAINALGAQLEAKARDQAQTEAELLEMATHLDGREVVLQARTGTQDRLYGSITTADIATELENVTGLAIDKRKIDLVEPIRQLGSYEINIKLAKDIVPQIRVTVSEQATEKPDSSV